MKEFFNKFNKLTILLVIAGAVIICAVAGYYLSENERNKENDVVVKSADESGKIYVHVKGEVKNPGLYEFAYGDRIHDAIERAGGTTDNADVNKINLARLLTDEMEVIVPSNIPETSDGGKININTADVSELQNINGVGEATAEKIIKYREENGAFGSIEEIMNIDGIGQKNFESMKDDISVY